MTNLGFKVGDDDFSGIRSVEIAFCFDVLGTSSTPMFPEFGDMMKFILTE
jgi:hypothetical protein